MSTPDDSTAPGGDGEGQPQVDGNRLQAADEGPVEGLPRGLRGHADPRGDRRAAGDPGGRDRRWRDSTAAAAPTSSGSRC